MFQNAKLPILASILLASASASTAQEVTTETPTENLIVYGSRLQQSVTEYGSTVSILTADDISALGSQFVVDALATLPAVTINQNGAFGGSASVRIRGASSNQTLVIIDGVVANDPTSPGGGFDFSRLDPANIERIEVLKGPHSTLWGTDAIGGVVNITTKRPKVGLGGKVYSEAGSFDTYRNGVEISNKNDRYDFRLSVNNVTSNGISKADENNGNNEKDGFESINVNSLVGVNFGDARLEGSILWTEAETEFDSYSPIAQGGVADGDEVSETEELVSNIKLMAPLFNGRLNNTILLGYSDIDRKNLTNNVQSFENSGDRRLFRYQGTLSLGYEAQLAFGAEREKTETKDEDATIDGLFGLYELKLFETLTLTAGVRYDEPEHFDSETTTRFTFAHNPSDYVTFRGSWGEGYKAPTIFQTTYVCTFCSNPNPQASTNLRPESSEGFDVGIDLRTANQRGEVSLTYFDQKTDDQIDFVFSQGGYINVEEANSTGIELAGRYRLLDWLIAGLNYSYIDAEDDKGNTLDRIPEHSGNFSLLFNNGGKWSSTLLITYNDEEQDRGEIADSWTRVDLSSSFAVTEKLDLYARIENLFDEQYQQILGYGTPDRSAYLGLRFTF